MTRTRTAKVKAVPQPTRQDRLDDIAMAKFVLKRLRKQPKRSKNWCEWPGCNKFFSRKPDVERHVRSMHLKLKDHVCRVCGKRFAQKTTRDNHEYTHKGIKPYRCDLATESGGICNKLFSDGSSLTRHRSEQHGVVKFQCPYPNCVDRAGNPKCIKRRSEFRKHLSTQHGLVVDSLNPYAVHDEVDGLPVQAAAGPSKARPARSSRQTRRRPARAPSIDDDESVFTPPPPMYSETLNAGEVNLILVPDDDGCTSTPGLSFTSPSPCPSASDVRYENATPPPAYSNFQGCDANNYGFLPNKDMDMSAYPVDGAFGTEETWTDAELFNTLLQVQDFGALSYGNMPIPYPCGLPVPESYGFNDATYEAFTQMPIPDTSYSQFFSAPEQTGYEQFGQYPVWDMPAPELSYNDELPNMIVPPSLLQFSPTDPFAYVPQ